MGKILRWIMLILVGILLIGVVVYLLGPKPRYEKVNAFLPSVNADLDSLDNYVAAQESLVPNIKPDNESYIVWADSFQKTPYALLYLHGFSASPVEGDPVHKDLSKRYGSNLYIPRLAGHGINDRESFKDLTPMKYMNSAKKAFATAQLLGDTVIIIATSTGAPLATYLAAEHPDLVHALIFYSPNFKVANPFMPLATGPWGKEILRSAVGSDYREIHGEGEEEQGKYWTYTYRIEGLMAMQALLDQTATKEIFGKISIPYFIGYYYKNENEKDQTVSIDAMKYFDQHTATPQALKHMQAFPDAGAHVLTSPLTSKDIESVEKATFRYFEEVLGIQPVQQDTSSMNQ